MALNYLPDSKIIKVNDFESGRANNQWYSNGNLVLAANSPDLKDKVFYLVYARGTGIQLINGGITVFSGQDHPLFDHNPIRLSNQGFSITGSIDYLYGFYVPIY